jgi:putative redox protein
MSVHIDIEYLGGLRTQAKHGPSGTTLVTDAPVDNHGKGESFSPTDLCATSLGTCMLTTMGIYAERHGIELRGTTCARREDHGRRSGPPHRAVGYRDSFAAATRIIHNAPPSNAAALTCPVHQSLHPDVEKPVTFLWQGLVPPGKRGNQGGDVA